MKKDCDRVIAAMNDEAKRRAAEWFSRTGKVLKLLKSKDKVKISG